MNAGHPWCCSSTSPSTAVGITIGNVTTADITVSFADGH
jgi:hypothetical protein